MPDNGEVARRGEHNEPERRREFVPDPDRVVYPVDHITSQRAALAKFEAEVRVVVGGQLTRRMVKQACDLEDEIRARAYDNAHFSQLEVAVTTYLADAIEIRHRYMNPDEQQGGWR